MPNSIFINYRRSDSQHVAFAIADRLLWAFGKKQVFFDRSSIESGDPWPSSIKKALDSARLVLVVIGPSWLQSTDKWGRRRLDDPRDWVRSEICRALHPTAGRPKAVVPVFVNNADSKVLSPEALDRELRALGSKQKHEIRDAKWYTDLRDLVRLVERYTKLKARDENEEDNRNPNGSPVRPRRKFKGTRILSDTEVRHKLAECEDWHVEWTAHEWGIEGQAQEIVKRYTFREFVDAVEFMRWASPKINDEWRPPHHPRWENQWRALVVRFSTWDVGCRLTKYDIMAAKDFDDLHRSFWEQRHRERSDPARQPDTKRKARRK